MSLRTRTNTFKRPDSDEEKDTTPLIEPSSSAPPTTTFSSSTAAPASVPLPQRALSQALASTAHLANLLPTGTLLAFQFLTPVFTNNGSCDAATRPLTLLLLLALAASCFLACFTDSFKSTHDGKVYYGIATSKGMQLFDYPTSAPPTPDLSGFRIRGIDWLHAVLSVLVFGAVAIRDRNVARCFYPRPEKEVEEVLGIVPLGIGFCCSLLFVVFPTRRHGIGYPVTGGADTVPESKSDL